MKCLALTALVMTSLALAACERQAPGGDTGAAAGQPPAATATATTAATPAEPLMATARELFKVIPDAAPDLPGNAATPEKVALGKMLYLRPHGSPRAMPSAAVPATTSVSAAPTTRRPRSAIAGSAGDRNAPTVLNAVFNTAQFWDGRAADLEAQAGGPMVNPVEMASPEVHVPEQLRGIPGYREAFARAFPGDADPVTLANAQKAIAVFEAGLLTPDAPFDRYLKGDAAALSAEQKEGLSVFVDKGCIRCHNGINIGGAMYAKFGVFASPGAKLLPPGDKGRFTVTKAEGDQYSFKVPTLRNITLTAPYFHTGTVWDLRQAVAVMGDAQLGSTLSEPEIDKLTAFMGSLTGKQPEVTMPILPPSVATTPRPKP